MPVNDLVAAAKILTSDPSQFAAMSPANRIRAAKIYAELANTRIDVMAEFLSNATMIFCNGRTVMLHHQDRYDQTFAYQPSLHANPNVFINRRSADDIVAYMVNDLTTTPT